MATSNSHLPAAVVVSPASLCTVSPSNQPSRARTNALIRAPRMPDTPPRVFRDKLLSNSPPPELCRGGFMPPSSFLSIPLPRLFSSTLSFLYPSSHYASNSPPLPRLPQTVSTSDTPPHPDS